VATANESGHSTPLPDETDTSFSNQRPVPATHRHAIRRLLARLDDPETNATYDEASVYSVPTRTVLRLYGAEEFSTRDVRRALQGRQIDWEMAVYRNRTTVRLKP